MRQQVCNGSVGTCGAAYLGWRSWLHPGCCYRRDDAIQVRLDAAFDPHSCRGVCSAYRGEYRRSARVEARALQQTEASTVAANTVTVTAVDRRRKLHCRWLDPGTVCDCSTNYCKRSRRDLAIVSKCRWEQGHSEAQPDGGEGEQYGAGHQRWKRWRRWGRRGLR
jgi:hypothetical protein